MRKNETYEIIIIGGSYSGLSAAMALGRALRNVLIIDSAKPCNRQTPHSHNFITQDGAEPAEIARKAREQVLKYDTVAFVYDLVTDCSKNAVGFELTTESGEQYSCEKLIFASGVKDNLLEIDGFSDCWGKTIIHCPYCHGFEVKGEKTGILANGDFAMHYAQLIRNWTNDLSIYTNGKATFSHEQAAKLNKFGIPVIETKITSFEHTNGALQTLIFEDHSTIKLKALYARPPFEQHCKIPEKLGCELNEMGLIKVDMFQKTSVANIYACGDNSSPMRSLAFAVSSGNIAGAVLTNELTEGGFA